MLNVQSASNNHNNILANQATTHFEMTTAIHADEERSNLVESDTVTTNFSNNENKVAGDGAGGAGNGPAVLCVPTHRNGRQQGIEREREREKEFTLKCVELDFCN